MSNKETEKGNQADQKPGHSFVSGILLFVLRPFEEIGELCRLFGQAVFWGVRPPFRFRQIVSSMHFIGVGSVFLVGLTGLFVGMVSGLQLVDGFRDFGAENQTGGVVGLGLTRELGPVFAALMVSSRAGSAMTTEIGSMRVTQQIDALKIMAVEPVQYLVTPRLIAGIVMVPVLTIFFTLIGIFGAWFICVNFMGLDPGVFVDRVRWLVDWPDVMMGLTKAVVFGLSVCLISCKQGFFASGGAAGVGQATNRAVVHGAVAILVLDYIVTALFLGASS